MEINMLENKNFKVAAISHYDDEAEQFIANKVDFIYDYKSSIGDDFAEKSIVALG
jgi:hypothetical protein